MPLVQGKLLDKFLKVLDDIVDLKDEEFPKTVSI